MGSNSEVVPSGTQNDPEPSLDGAAPPTILFDGVCNLCSGAVQFVIEKERAPYFQFASLQSDWAKNILGPKGVDSGKMSTILLLQGDRLYRKSEAILRIAHHLRVPWSWFSFFSILPLAFRDWVYDVIAARRYQWFGRKDHCMIPAPELARRFYDS